MKIKFLVLAPLALSVLSGCTRQGKFQPVDMWNGARLKPYEGFHFFANNSEAQVPPAGTVARSENRVNEPLYYGTQNGTLVTYNPLMQSAKNPQERLAILQRGQERYQIYCQPCHGLGGYGDGLIIKRGLAAPPSYHDARIVNAADGHIYDVIANGYGSMYSYGARVPTQDRWAIVAYVRALQRSQNAKAGDVPAGTDLSKPQVVPPVNNERKYQGGSGGSAYSRAGNGNESDSASGPQDLPMIGEEQGDLNFGQIPTAQLGQPPRNPVSPEQNSSPSPSGMAKRNGDRLISPQQAEAQTKSSVTSPAAR